ncbi:hypothetical protein GGH99_007917 [Coemansia sp. RSA 1285]|nr:hypothetical protein GGH99_007917 [Coemansia sp. RSA 1285]
MTDQSLDTAQSIFVPPTKAETIIFYVSLAVNLSTILLIIYSFIFRSYPPMRAQHVGITASIGIGSVVFSISNNLAQGMAKYEGFLGVCNFWGVWVIMTFGVGLFQSAINMRFVLFYRIFVTGNTYTRSKFNVLNFFRRFWPFFALWLPAVITSIVVTALPGRRGAWLLEDHGLRACDFSYGYLYWVYAYFAAQIVLSWLLYLKMRSIAHAFNGFRIAIWTLLVFTVILIVNMVINIVKGSNSSWGRIAIALCNMVFINGYMWFILGVPVLGHMFWREQTMRTFMNSLHKDALIAQQTRAFGLESQAYGVSDHDIYAHSSYGNGEELAGDNLGGNIHKMDSHIQLSFKSPEAVYAAGRTHVL